MSKLLQTVSNSQQSRSKKQTPQLLERRLVKMLIPAVTMAGILNSAETEAATMRCKGFAFVAAEFECMTADPPVKAASFCDVMNRQGGAFLWSRNDTEATKNRADLINAVGKRLCGWSRK